MYDAFRHNNGSGDNVRTVRTCESLPLGAVYCTCSLSPTPAGWFVVCMAYAQQIEEDMHASPTGGQAARYDSNEPSGIPHADPNHRAISCRLPEVHAVGKPLGRKPAWWISKIATNHFNYQPNHNSRVKSLNIRMAELHWYPEKQTDDYIIYHPSNRSSFSLGNFSTSNIRLVHGAVFVQFSSKNATIVGPRHIVDEISKKL